VDLTTIEARKYTKPEGKLNIHNNSTILNARGGEGALEADFVFTTTYEPNVGLIRLEGRVRLEDDEKVVAEALSFWRKSKNKNLPQKTAEKMHNRIISECMLEASILARDIHLPAPMPTPAVNMMGSEKPDVDAYIR